MSVQRVLRLFRGTMISRILRHPSSHAAGGTEKVRRVMFQRQGLSHTWWKWRSFRTRVAVRHKLLTTDFRHVHCRWFSALRRRLPPSSRCLHGASTCKTVQLEKVLSAPPALKAVSTRALAPTAAEAENAAIPAINCVRAEE